MHTPDPLLANITEQLEACQADNIVTMDIQNVSSIADYMIICTGRSSTHLKSIVSHLKEGVAVDFRINIEGMDSNEWMVMDFGSIIIHVMKSETRDFYRLESLWGQPNESESENDDEE